MVAGQTAELGEGLNGGPGRGRPGHMTRESIIRAGAKIPCEEFSLGRLAEALGTSPQSIYHYFPNKESIFTSIALEIAKALPMTDPELPWRAYLQEIMLGYRKFLSENDYPFVRGLNYSGLAIFRVAGAPSEDMMRRLDQLLAVLRRDGFGPEASMEVWVILQNFLRRSDLHRAQDDAMSEVWDELMVDIGEAGGGLYPEVEKWVGAPAPDVDSLYQSVVDVIIEGISVRFGVK